MTQQNESGIKSFLSATALEPYRRVKLTAARTVGYAGAGEKSIGITQDRVGASTLEVPVALWNRSGTFEVEATAAAISAAANVYGAASGKISTTAVGQREGVAIKAAGGTTGERIEIVFTGEEAAQAAVVVKTAAALTAGTLGGTTGGTVACLKVRGTGYSAGPVADISGNIQKLKLQVNALGTDVAAILTAIKAAGLMASA